MTCGGHPVCGQADVGERRDVRGSDVEHCFSDGEPRGGGAVVNGDRRALTHRERLTRVTLITCSRHRDVADGNLPGTYELIARDEAANRAVADMNKERLVGDGGKR